MKINKWTLGLAAVGLVSFASVTQAEEATSTLMTALSSTSISGYVDTSAQWNLGSGAGSPGYAFAAGKNDGFNINSVLVTLEKPLEEGEWSAGYKASLMWGHDAPAVTGSGTPIREAYVALRAPVGNGLDLKLGRWDTIIGYESTDSYKNPNFTRSYGYTLTQTEHTGVLATYQAMDALALNVGVANTATIGALNGRSTAETRKAYMASVAITAPDSMGMLAGSAFYLGIIDGFGNPATGEDVTDFYAGMTISSGVEGLSLGADYNYFDDIVGGDSYTAALYLSFKASEKFGLHFRGEYGRGGGLAAATRGAGKVIALTSTISYELWENVLSRLEFRVDHAADGSNSYNGKSNEFMLAANMVYKF